MGTDTIETISPESSLKIMSEVKKLKGATRAHLAIWQRLLTGQWYEALELARVNSFTGNKTARGLTHQLCDLYRSRRNSQARLLKITSYIELMTTEAESGLNIRDVLSPLADQWSLEPAPDPARPTRRQKKVIEERGTGTRTRTGTGTRGTGTGTGKGARELTCATRYPAPSTPAREESATSPEPRALERVIIAPASDPYYRHQSLIDLAQSIAQELPPPSLPDHKIGKEFTGRASGDLRATWLDYIDQVSRRWPGPFSAHDLSKITGAPVRWTFKLMEEHRALLERGITEERRRSMALTMTAEAEAIAREALALVQSSGDERIKATGLKLALDALARRQSLIGADKIALEARVEVTSGSWTDHAAAAGLTGDELRQIGDIASRAISRKGSEDD